MDLKDRIEKSGINYRNMEMRAVEPPAQPEGEAPTEPTYQVEGYATTFGQPYTVYEDEKIKVAEQIDARAFDEADMSDVIMQYDHAGHVLARTRNNTLSLTVDEKGLLVRADLSGTEEGRKLFDEIKGGYIDRMSFAFVVADDGDNFVRVDDPAQPKTTVTRTITKIARLYDVSAVSIPANGGTEISARSLAEGISAKLAAEAAKVKEQARKRAALELRLKLMEV